jgi:pSer/pThr/pTyr-binding forkhead associated (FHA) protein
VLQRFERRLGGLVEGLFARAFKSEVQPVEVAAALQRELDDQAAVLGRDRTLVPNHFVVELGDHDHARLAPYEMPLTHELAAMVREHAQDQRYTFVGPVEVELVRVPALETGVFRIESDVAPGPEGAPDPALASPRPPKAPPYEAAAQAGVRPDRFIDAGTTSAMPPTIAPSFGRLMVREGRSAAYEFELKHKVTVIGRGTDADLRLTDQSVSRRHAEFRVANGATMLNDLQSTNGTTVNGAAVTTVALADGDEIRLGETTLSYHAPTGVTARPDTRADRADPADPADSGSPGSPADHGYRS